MVIDQLWGVATHAVVGTLHSSDYTNKTIFVYLSSDGFRIFCLLHTGFVCLLSLSRDYGE